MWCLSSLPGSIPLSSLAINRTILAGMSSFSLQASGLLMGIAHWFKGKLWFSLVQSVAALLLLPCFINWCKPFCWSTGRTWCLRRKEKTSLYLILFHGALLQFYYEMKATSEQPSQGIRFCVYHKKCPGNSHKSHSTGIFLKKNLNIYIYST